MTSEQRAAARAIFAQGEPGFGISACKWMASKHIALQMGDTSANDAQPGGEEEGMAVPCHTDMQPRRGIWNLENVDTESLVAAGNQTGPPSVERCPTKNRRSEMRQDPAPSPPQGERAGVRWWWGFFATQLTQACENIPFGRRPHSRQVAACFASPASSWFTARKSPITVSGS